MKHTNKKTKRNLGYLVNLMLMIIMILTVVPLQAQSPLIIPDDVITVTGGAVSPDNPDIYEINMGNYENSKTYTITLHRPKGAQANYPVSIDWVIVRHVWLATYVRIDGELVSDPNGQSFSTGCITFNAGETQKTIQFQLLTLYADDNETASFILFGLGSRTKAQYPVIKMNFNNPNPVAPTAKYDYISVGLLNQAPLYIGAYSVNHAWSMSDNGHIEVMDNTHLRVNYQSLDHENYPVTINDADYTSKDTMLLKPEPPVGSITQSPAFLYKTSENMILTSLQNGRVRARLTCQTDSIMNLKMAFDGESFDRFSASSGMADVMRNGEQSIEVPPRFGTITTDAASYDIGETVSLTIPVLNSRLMQKLYPNNEWLEQIEVSFNGGQSFINRSGITFNSTTNTITAKGKAVNTSGSPNTVIAEVMCRKLTTDESFQREYFAYGANAAFTVTAQTAEFRSITTIDFILPENNQVKLNQTDTPVAFNPVFTPADATFESGVWISSHPEIGEVSISGVFTPKAFGKTTVTFVSDEKVYRQVNGLPVNDEVLTRSFPVYVVGDLPEVSTRYDYEKSDFEDVKLAIQHNLKGSSWQPDGEAKVKITHSDSGAYGSIADAFEITPLMIEEASTVYRLPFDEKLFPKTPTVAQYPFHYEEYGYFEEADSISAPPYKVEISIPLKQDFGDEVATFVLKATFDLHINLPHDPQVRLIQDMPLTAMSGDTLLLKYDVKYLTKFLVNPRSGFAINTKIFHNYISSAYEGEHPFVDNWFRYKSSLDDILTGKGALAVDPMSVPDWLELTDMGNYYNGVVTIAYPLPAPLGGVRPDKILEADRREDFDSRIYVGTDVIARNGVAPWQPFAYTDWKSVKTYTFDFDILEQNLRYQDDTFALLPLSEWNEQGVEESAIIAAVESANSSDYWGFQNFIRAVSRRSFLLGNLGAPPQWGDLVAGLTKHNSGDTIYTIVKDKFSAIYPLGDEYDLILSFPKIGEKRSYAFRSDPAAKHLYILKFDRQAHCASDTLYISYTNGAELPIEKKITLPHSLCILPYHYIIYEPDGIAGDVVYRTGTNRLASGSIIPLPAFAGKSDWGYFTEYYASGATNDLYVNECQLIGPQLAVSLVDRETGEKITSARINYAAHSINSNIDSGAEEVATWDDVLAVAASENWLSKGIVQGGSGEAFIATNEIGKEVLQNYLDGLLMEVQRKRISSLKYTLNDRSLPSGTLNASTDDVYVIQINEASSVPKIAMEVIADGYHPKFVTYTKEVKADGNNPEFFNYIRIQTSDVDYFFGNAIYTAGQGYRYHITVPLTKNTGTQRQSSTSIWAEKPDFFVTNASSSGINKTFTPISVSRYPNPVSKCDQKNLNTYGSNSIVPYSRYADQQNAVLNVNMYVENDWNPEDLLLQDGNVSIPPLKYNLISAGEGLANLEKKYVNLSYRLNDFIGYNKVRYPDITYHGTVVAELPGLKNDETDPAKYEADMKKELKDNIRLNPAQFNTKSFGQNADLGYTKKTMDKMDGLNLSLPDPIPFEFQTRTEGNRYLLRGILSVNFADYIPIVGQANMAMSAYNDLAENAERFEAAFSEVKNQVGLFKPKHRTKRFSTASVFAGIRGYVEGYGEYNPYSGDYEYGLNEGGIALELSASAYSNVNFVVGSLGVGLDALASATMGFSKPSEADLLQAVNKAKFDMWLETQLSMDVYVDLSAGLDIGIAGAKVGIRGNAGFVNKNKVVLKPYLANNNLTAGGLFNIHASLHLWAHAYFLFWSWEDEWKIFDLQKTWYYPNNNTNPYLRSSGGPQLRSMSEAYQRSSLALSTGIISDVAANAYPRYFNDGNSLMLSNLKTPAEQNDDRISIYTSNTSGLIDMLPGADLPAFGFDIASAANGATVVAYEQMTDSIRPIADKVSQETYLKTQSQNVDIFAAFKNGSGWQTTQLSDLGVDSQERKTDLSPKTAISPDGSKAAVVWKSGLTTIDSLGVKVNGNLLLSRYNGAQWSEPLVLASTGNLGDYSVAIDGESVVIATMQAEAGILGQNDAIGKIKLLFVSASDSIFHIETGRVGRKPQITRTGDHYYVSFMGQYALDDTTSVNDMYLLATTKNGQPIDSISGFAGMNSKVSFDYKLVGDYAANSINDLAILYNASQVVNDEVQTNLLATRFGRQNGTVFASEPLTLLTVSGDGTQLLISYDGFKSGNNLKAAATIANNSHGAIVVEESAVFENKIVCLSESFNAVTFKTGSEVNVEFMVQNKGYKPVRSITVTIGEDGETTNNIEVMPSDVQLIGSVYTIPENNTEPVDYTITARFTDGSTHIATGTLDLTAYKIKVNLVSLNSTDAKNTAIIEIVNQSTSPLTAQHEVTVGIYGDIFGETLYPGTALKTIPAYELFNDNGSGNFATKVATTALDIPVVGNPVTVYAIAKVKRNSMLRSNGEAEDVDQVDKSYATIQLFPRRVVGASSGQTIELGNGWNWISFNVENDNPALIDQFKTNASDFASQLKTGSGQFINNSGGSWSGLVISLNQAQSYLVKTTQVATLEITGSAVDPTDIPIILSPNSWSWIGYTPQSLLPITDALAGISAPQAGDQIKGQTGYSTFTSGNWIGSLAAMEPGSGYMYKSGNSETVSFKYPTSAANLKSARFVSNAPSVAARWETDPYRFAGTMTVTTSLSTDGEVIRNGTYEIAAFCGEECRGSAILQQVEGFENPLMGFLMIYGEDNNPITFKVYDHDTGTEYTVNERFNFQTDGTLGTPDKTYQVSLNSPTGLETIDNKISIHPNPVEKLLYINHSRSSLETITITDMSGRVIWTGNDFTAGYIDVSSLARGIYFLNIKDKGKIVVGKFIKK